MNANSTLVCSQEQAAALRDAVKEISISAWESFAYAPGESAEKVDPLRATRFFQAGGGGGNHLDTPLFEERYGLNPATRSFHSVKVGNKLGIQLELHPETVLVGPRISEVFLTLQAEILSYQSSIAHD